MKLKKFIDLSWEIGNEHARFILGTLFPLSRHFVQCQTMGTIFLP